MHCQIRKVVLRKFLAIFHIRKEMAGLRKVVMVTLTTLPKHEVLFVVGSLSFLIAFTLTRSCTDYAISVT